MRCIVANRKIECVQTAINLYWRALGSVRGLRKYEENYFEYVTSMDNEGPSRVFNISFPEHDTDTYIGDLVSRIKSKEVPNSLLITSETKPTNVCSVLKNNGFSLDDSGLCMVYEMTSKFAETENEIEIVRVDNRIDLEKWVHVINTALFECELLSIEQYEDIYNCENMSFYLAMKNGIAASACFTVHDGNYADLDMVATLNEYRRKGIASELVRHSMNDLYESGISLISLRAEVGGIELYKRIGFEEVCKRISAEYIESI